MYVQVAARSSRWKQSTSNYQICYVSVYKVNKFLLVDLNSYSISNEFYKRMLFGWVALGLERLFIIYSTSLLLDLVHWVLIQTTTEMADAAVSKMVVIQFTFISIQNPERLKKGLKMGKPWQKMSNRQKEIKMWKWTRMLNEKIFRIEPKKKNKKTWNKRNKTQRSFKRREA